MRSSVTIAYTHTIQSIQHRAGKDKKQFINRHADTCVSVTCIQVLFVNCDFMPAYMWGTQWVCLLITSRQEVHKSAEHDTTTVNLHWHVTARVKPSGEKKKKNSQRVFIVSKSSCKRSYYFQLTQWFCPKWWVICGMWQTLKFLIYQKSQYIEYTDQISQYASWVFFIIVCIHCLTVTYSLPFVQWWIAISKMNVLPPLPILIIFTYTKNWI